MPSFKVYCDSCETETEVFTDEKKSYPEHCPYCGSYIPEENINQLDDEEDWSDADTDEWNWEEDDK